MRYPLFSFTRTALSWTLGLSLALLASKIPANPTSGSDSGVTRVSISTLQLAIVGTIVTKDKNTCVVLLKYQSTNEVKAHRVGNVLLGKYTLFDITENSITLQLYEQNRVSLLMAYRDKFFQDLQKSTPKAVEPVATGITGGYKEDGFERVGGDIRITEAYKDSYLSPSKLTETLMHAAAEPYMQNGQIVGFKMDLIDADSLYAKAGLTNGDVITEINGIPLNNAAAAIRLLQSLRNTKSLSMSLLRGGVVSPLNITVE